MWKPSTLTTGTMIVRLLATMLRRAGVTAVVGQQVVGELHRVLDRGPLAGVVGAHHEEDRLAVVDVRRVGRDLDAAHRATLDARVGEGDLPHELRVVLGQLVELGVDLVERAVARCCRSAARTRRRLPRTAWSAARALRMVAPRSASSTRQVKPAARSFAASDLPWRMTSTPVSSPCSVVSSPSSLTFVRSAWLLARTCTTWTFSSGAFGAAAENPAPASTTAAARAPATGRRWDLTRADFIGCSSIGWCRCGRPGRH